MQKKVIVIGHVDHGKTTFIDALKKIIYGETDAEPVVTSKSVSFQVGQTGYTLFDYPGHADYAEQIGKKGERLAILICSAMDGLMPEAKEQIRLCKERGIEKIAVFFSNLDAGVDPEFLEFAKEDLVEFLDENGYGRDFPMGFGSSCAALQGEEENQKKLLDFVRAADAFFG